MPNVVIVTPRARQHSAASDGMSPIPVPTSSRDTLRAALPSSTSASSASTAREPPNIVFERATSASERATERIVHVGIVENLEAALA